VVAMETDEIVLVAFVVPHEDVLAMNRTVILPPTFRFLYGLAFGMAVAREGYVPLPQVVEDSFLSFRCHVESRFIRGKEQDLKGQGARFKGARSKI